MIHLRLRTEYSFRRAFGRIDKVIERAGGDAVAITDNSTWGHVAFFKAAKKAEKKPLLGVEVNVVQDAALRERQYGREMAFLARNAEGLKEVYALLTLANDDAHFYYHPRLDYNDVNSISHNVIILSGAGADLDRLRPGENVYLEMNPGAGPWNAQVAAAKGWQTVVCADNFYPTVEDRKAWEILVHSTARGGRGAGNRTAPMHIPTEDEMRMLLPMADEDAFLNTERIAAMCDVELPKARMVEFKSKRTLRAMCNAGAKKLSVNLKDKKYKERLEHELKLIKEKGYQDYFFVIADMVNDAKKKMLVGPARGSSAGSLVCYLCGITDIDPLKHGLMFERFIDTTRDDLPDIDIDFPDARREEVWAHLVKKYGDQRVGHLGTILRYKPKSAIRDVAKALGIPLFEISDLQGAIIERSSGDARAQFSIADAFESLDIGKRTLKKYPQLSIAAELEGHAQYSGTHAAGYLVADSPITEHCSLSHDGTMQIDKKDAESINLLKIDALGLRTLTVIDDCLKRIGKTRDWLVNYPLDDDACFDLFNEERMSGIFQFEGYALQILTRQMGVRSFNDIAALTALARPGPLHSGGASDFVDRRTGNVKVEYLHPLVKEATEDTFGVVIYQEQVMSVGRILGDLSWEDVNQLRRAMSKSLGDEFFNKYLAKFLKGTKKRNIPEARAKQIWEKMVTFGCLSGDTIIQLPRANQYSPRQITLRELYHNGGIAKIATASSNRAAQRNRKAKLLTMVDKIIQPRRLQQVVSSGIKTTWLLTTEDGHQIRATKDHKFYSEKGWMTLRRLSIGDLIAVKGDRAKAKKYKGTGSGAHNIRTGASKLFLERIAILQRRYKRCQRCKKAPYQETHHIDEDRQNNAWDNLLPVCRKCHKSFHPKPQRWSKGYQIACSRIVSISDPREEETFDITMSPDNPSFLANDIIVHNSWAFNKSHAISYGTISYWCAVLKTHYPLEFAVSTLTYARDHEQSIRLLREMVEMGIAFVPVDTERSEVNWSIHDGKLVGGLINIKGLGEKKAADILYRRANGIPLQPGQRKLLADPVTPFDSIFEGKEKFGDIYANPAKYNVLSQGLSYIRDIHDNGMYIFLAKIKEKNLRDLNEYASVVKRGGRLIKTKNLFLNLLLEDDTGTILATIGRNNYERLGKPIIEGAKIGDWYIWKGTIDNNWRKVQVRACVLAEERLARFGGS